VYQAGSGTTAKVLARGLGVLPMEKQVEELKGWLQQMAAQIPGEGGLTEAQRAEQLKAKNEAVLTV
jgi:transcription-repair coupling factor (superfamily II helicase)